MICKYCNCVVENAPKEDEFYCPTCDVTLGDDEVCKEIRIDEKGKKTYYN